MCVWVISAAGSVDGFRKVSEQSEHNVLTFRTERVGKIIIMFLITQNTKMVPLHMNQSCVLEPAKKYLTSPDLCFSVLVLVYFLTT